MDYYVRELPHKNQMRGAWGKARSDINEILNSMGITPLDIQQGNHTGLHRYTRNIMYRFVWKKALSVLVSGDRLIVQYPPIENTIFLEECFRDISQRGVEIILIIHDLIALVDEGTLKKRIYSVLEPRILEVVTWLIVHNRHMAQQVAIKNAKKVSLEIFDYLIPDFQQNKMDDSHIRKSLPIIVAGNLAPYKTQYLYNLPDNCEFNLFGVGYQEEGKKNIHYQGAFSPDELPYVLCGSFGLVWDGESAETCVGKFGEYLKINNPHKTSLYLACGIPVIIWKQAAMADFVLSNKCGLVIDSLYEISDKIATMSEKEYEQLKMNAQRVGQEIREGCFMKMAIRATLN